jgi:BirA family transcriptional regulator, biotin operon repressor / biotin---[acetyl-CoA-carboxylase] ligase
MDRTILAGLLEGLPVPQIRTFDSIGSTNDEALEWAAAGADDGCLVIADQQTQGRGRLGRHWVTQPGAALAFSLILHPRQEELQHLGFFSPLGALAISQALEDSLGLNPQIKWPNDVLLKRHKAAGILVEAAWVGEKIQGMVIGIGLNVTQAAVPPAEMLMFPATSVEAAAGHPVDRLDLLRAILRALFTWRTQITSQAFHQAWEQRLAFLNEWVQIEEAAAGSPPITGQLIGVDTEGGLLLRDAAGAVRPVATGDVHLRPVK